MKLVSILLSSLLVLGCSSKPVTKEIPKESIGSAGTALGQDIIKTLDAYFVKNYNCTSWGTQSVKHNGVMGELVFTKSGQIQHGIVGENWKISYCGEDIKLNLLISTDGAGGSRIVIREL